MHHKPIKINLDEFDSFDWIKLTTELKDLALEINPLMYMLDRSYLWIVREKTFKGSVFEVCVLFMFIYKGISYQFSHVITNTNDEFIIVDKFHILNDMLHNINNVVRKIIRERNASK